MNLTEYFGAERGRIARAAKAAGLAPALLSQIAAGDRPVPVRRAAALEAATGYVVRRWHMFPCDWHLIWPELVGTEGAPDVPEPQATEAALSP